MRYGLIYFLVAGFFFFSQTAKLSAYQNRVKIYMEGDYRHIESNGIPGHETGPFPNPHNPNTISEQNFHYKVPARPQIAATLTKVELWPFGIAQNGIPFDPNAAEFWNNDPNSGWRYEALSGAINLGFDQNMAHVQPGGIYHYHGVPKPLLSGQKSSEHSKLMGYAADGFPIFAIYGYADPNSAAKGVKELKGGYRIKKGVRPNGPGGTYDGTFVQDYEYVPGTGDLDECNGRKTYAPGYDGQVYAYYITNNYPVIPRCLKGSPDPSFVRKPFAHPPHPYGGPPGRRGPPGR